MTDTEIVELALETLRRRHIRLRLHLETQPGLDIPAMAVHWADRHAELDTLSAQIAELEQRALPLAGG